MERTELEKWISENKSIREIKSISGKGYSTIRYWLNKYSLSTNFDNFSDSKFANKGNKYTKEQIENAILLSNNYSDVFRNLGIKINGGSYTWIKNLIKSFNINIDHFSKLNENLIKSGIEITHNRQKTIYSCPELIKNNDTRFAAQKLRNYLTFNGIPEKCNICGISDWNDVPLRLDIDHIDGDYRNNKLVNLQFICPNCHRQKTSASSRKSLNK